MIAGRHGCSWMGSEGLRNDDPHTRPKSLVAGQQDWKAGCPCAHLTVTTMIAQTVYDLSGSLPAQPRPQIGPCERPCMLIKPCLREHPGWEFGDKCSAGSHFNCRKAIFRRGAVGHLRSPWPEKAAWSVPGMGSRRQDRNLLSHKRSRVAWSPSVAPRPGS
jgi:hypothetical protein